MNGVSGGDTSFMFVATVLVMIMTPGLALFYGGMVKRKNVLNTTMYSYVAMIFVSVQWVLIGYTLVFGKDVHGIIGGLEYLGLKGVGFAPNAEYAATIPHNLFMLFQMMFAIITPALISGAFAERMKFSAFIIFLVAWVTLIYDPLAHWVWGVGGWIRELGALDFAGGNVVHISSGASGLVAAIMIGKRKEPNSTPHHIPMIVLGAALLWFGWFGFNAGSALGINDVAMNAFVTTNTSAAAAAISWVTCEWFCKKKVGAIGLVTGVVAGLVSITPSAGFVTPISALVIGLIGGAVCFFSVTFLKDKLGYDDALDAFGCHGIGGTWGGIATGLFATKSVNPAGADGLLYGNVSLLGAQVISVIATYALAIVGTFIILKVISLFTSLRVSEKEEEKGLDKLVHNEDAYAI